MEQPEGDNADRHGDVDPAVRTQILLAEYTALQAEVERRTILQWNVFALQLASAGAIASIAISATSNLALALPPVLGHGVGLRR